MRLDLGKEVELWHSPWDRLLGNLRNSLGIRLWYGLWPKLGARLAEGLLGLIAMIKRGSG